MLLRHPLNHIYIYLFRRGEIDFNESLRQRVGLLTGTPATVIDVVKERLQFTPGAFELCRALKKLGFKLAVLSGIVLIVVVCFVMLTFPLNLKAVSCRWPVMYKQR